MEVYTDPTIQDGDNTQVLGYYKSTTVNYLLEFYGDFDIDSPMEPHSVLTMTGMVPPASAWDGGYILVSGVVTFEDVPNPFHPEDSLMAFLNATGYTVFIPGGSLPSTPGQEKREQNKTVQ